MKKKLLMALMAMTLCATVLVGCSKDDKDSSKDDKKTEDVSKKDDAKKDDDAKTLEETLEDFYGRDDVKKEFESQFTSLKESFSSVYSDMDWKVEGNTFEYTYTFKEEIPADQIDAFKETTGSSLQTSAKSAINDMKTATGIKDEITLRYIYCNPDGTEIFNESYSN